VANLSLSSETALGGYDKKFGNTRLQELQGVSIFSIALPNQPTKALASMTTVLNVGWPDTGYSAISDSGNCTLLGLQADQVFALLSFPEGAIEGEPQMVPQPNIEQASVTDQSDSWAGLVLDGPLAVSALERICPIDLHPDSFGAGQVARTIMEHLAVVILCVSNNRYVLLSPRSSSASFLHAMVQSLQNTID